jgi:type IV pilus assembly protein PilB
MAKHSLGQMFVEQKVIHQDDLERCLLHHKKTGKKLETILMEEGLVTEQQMLQALVDQAGFPFVDLQRVEIDENALRAIDRKLAERFRIFPVRLSGQVLTVATADPLNLSVMDDLLLITGYEIRAVVSPQKDIEWAINRYYLPDEAEKTAASGNPEILLHDSFMDQDEDTDMAQAISLVRSVISTAIARRASDIHIEPHEFEVVIRFRIDGILSDIMTIPNHLKSAVISRLKIMGQLKITEKRRPQDGGFHLKVDNRMLDIRMSVLPTVFGEKIVLRLLNRENIYELDKLGFDAGNMAHLRKIIRSPYGIFLVTGPTGSGKTTTLYAILNELDHIQKNITTVEDPVEYVLPRINQIQINAQIGLTFANGLRSILRQDPDIIMVGEIRDEETAKMAVQAALTGHFVLSTLHTNDAIGSINRLLNMGIEPYLLASSVRGVMAQRLVRKICPECKMEEDVPESVLARTGVAKNPYLPKVFYKGRGCTYCQHSGYKGRISINEIIPVDEHLSSLIRSGADEQEMKQYARSKGFSSLEDDGLKKVAQGRTTLEEYIRVVQT